MQRDAAMIAKLVARAVERVRAGEPERGSLVMAILVALIGIGLTAVLLPIVIMSTRSTVFDQSRVREINAAEAGTAVALGLIRSASDAAGNGVLTKLPCTTDGPITGTVAGSAADLSYSVRIAYYTENPLGKAADWLAVYDGTNAGHGMRCATGAGTYYPPTGEQVPSFVQVTSTGTDSRSSRTLRSIYVVKTTNANVAGGTIYVFPSGAQAYCMDAGSAQPVAGVAMKIQPCVVPPVQQQAWSYDKDLSIRLVSSVTSAYPNGLCLSSPPSKPQQYAGDPIMLQPCAGGGNAPWYQKWSVNNVSHLEGARSDLTNTDGLCIDVAAQAAGKALTLQSCYGGVTDSRQTWVPSPDVGAGMAGAANDQIVNFQQFGRCMDVTDTDVTKGFLIAYTCKQNPDPTKVLWNQKFSYDSTTKQLVTNNGSPYCLTSPRTAYDSTVPGPYVTLTACNGTIPPGTQWTQYGGTDTDGNPLPPLVKYTVQDDTGLCLSLTTGTQDAYNGQYSKVIVEACDGSLLQKWNASADVQAPALQNIQEIIGSGG